MLETTTKQAMCGRVALALVAGLLFACVGNQIDKNPLPTGTGSDTGAATGGDTADTGAAPRADTAAPGAAFLEACADDGDCSSGRCVPHFGDDVCSRGCAEEDCPAGWTCRQLAEAGGGTARLCVSDGWASCRPCAANADCALFGEAGAACVDLGDFAAGCQIACEGDDDCGEGFTCGEGATVDGAAGRFCLPDSGGCDCDARWAVQGLSAACFNSNDFGRCPGTRACTAAGYETCDADEPAAEVGGDGIDNDCDGQTDEIDCLCGNGACEAGCGETLADCPCDCAVCGDGTCSPCGENPSSCPEDCCRSIDGTSGCGDGFCLGFGCGENPTTCANDCATPCGDGTCDRGENPTICAEDCKHKVCGNGVCEGTDGGPDACPQDCGTFCGNCECEADQGESLHTCPIDCGFCGDGVCSPCGAQREDATTCAADCCVPDCGGRVCGDDGCGGTCGSCPDWQVCTAGGRCGGPNGALGVLCQGCAADADCAGANADCVLLNDERVCGSRCADDAGCPEGFSCVRFDPDDAESGRCVAASGSCQGCFVSGCPSGQICNPADATCTEPEPVCGACTSDAQCSDDGTAYCFRGGGNVCAPACGRGDACPAYSRCEDHGDGRKFCTFLADRCCYGPGCGPAVPADVPADLAPVAFPDSCPADVLPEQVDTYAVTIAVVRLARPDVRVADAAVRFDSVAGEAVDDPVRQDPSDTVITGEDGTATIHITPADDRFWRGSVRATAVDFEPTWTFIDFVPAPGDGPTLTIYIMESAQLDGLALAGISRTDGDGVGVAILRDCQGAGLGDTVLIMDNEDADSRTVYRDVGQAVPLNATLASTRGGDGAGLVVNLPPGPATARFFGRGPGESEPREIDHGLLTIHPDAVSVVVVEAVP